MSCFSLTEFFGDIFISWLPLYYEAKLLLLLYLVHPKTAGALKLYDQVLHLIKTAPARTRCGTHIPRALARGVHPPGQAWNHESWARR
jgi:hypothetical protein